MKRGFLPFLTCFVLLASIFIGGCFLSEKYRFIEAGKEAVAARLFDPKAAEFRNLKAYIDKTDEVLCGEVNGKNRYGAYTGFNYFVASRVALSEKDIWFIGIDSEKKEEHETYMRMSKRCETVVTHSGRPI